MLPILSRLGFGTLIYMLTSAKTSRRSAYTDQQLVQMYDSDVGLDKHTAYMYNAQYRIYDLVHSNIYEKVHSMDRHDTNTKILQTPA